jgi:WD40-like Beta Propeller Repeat
VTSARGSISERAFLLGAVALTLTVGCARFGYEWLSTVDAGPSTVGAGGATGSNLDAGAGGVPGLVPRAAAGTSGSAALPEPLPPDASSPPGVPDAASPVVTQPCAALGAFGAPERVQGLGAGPFFSPALDSDGLVLLFASAAPGDVFSARRASRETSTFSDVRPLGVNSQYAEVTPSLSADGLTLWFASDRPGAQSFRDLLTAQRASLDDDFENADFVTEANSFWTENLPSTYADGTLLLFSSDRPGVGIMDLWQASRAGNSGPFSNFEPMPVLNSAFDDSGARLTADLLHVYFTSERDGGAGGRDLWFADRSDASEPFGEPQNLADLNGSADDADAAVSSDGRELFFVSTRSGEGQIWRSVRACAP